MKNLVSTATTLEQLRDEIAEMARLYATQERLVSNIGKSKRKEAEHLQAARAIGILAEHIGQITLTSNPIDNLDERQTATVLHALRVVQEIQLGTKGGCHHATMVDDADPTCCPHFDGIEPLTAEEIDALCERLNYGVEQPKDEQQTQRCVYCGGDVPQDVAAEVPTVSDQEAWERISKYHTSRCEWVNTRAHRGDYEQPEEESQPEAHVCFSDARTWADGKRHCQKCDKPMERSQW